VAFGFVEDIHVSSKSCKDVQAHASLSKDFAGSLLDRLPTDSEVLRSGRPLLTVRQVAKLLGVCPATVYRLRGRGDLPHFRVLNAIRVDPRAVTRLLSRSRR
jgi:excisionase family DNA binding protein